MKDLPPLRLVPEPLDEAARELPKFALAPAYVGTRHKLGGEPDFIQNADWPFCRACQQKKTFYAQLDSISDEHIIADCGMIYVFLCYGCYEATSIVQSY
jgi:hypothetical protein